MNVKQLWHTDEFTSILKEQQLISENLCAVKSMYSFISIGTEKLVITKQISLPAWDFMRVPYMEGSFNLPCTYGYSLVGSIISDKTDLPSGTIVHLMHPHQDYVSVPADCLTPIHSLPPKRATLIANMETALNACWDVQIKNGSNVLIAGYGIIGALLARLLTKEFCCKVAILEINESRIALLNEHGYDVAANSVGNFDTAFNTTASEIALQYCIEKVKKNGTVAELSWYGNKSVQLHLGTQFHYNRIKILSSQVSTISEYAPVGCTFEKRKQIVMQILKDDFYDQLITDEISFSTAAEFFNQLRTSRHLQGLGYVINYNL